MKKYIKLSILSLLVILLTACFQQQNNNIKPIPIIPNPTPIIPSPTCIDEDEGIPVITSISVNSWTVETKLEINWCNFSSFEWDKNVWIENEKWIKWILYSESGSTSKLLNISLKPSICQNDNSYSGLECSSWFELIPGKYKIYVMPWWKKSNKVDFTIIPSEIIIDLSYQDIIDYIDKNITEIINNYSKIKPTNWKWFADWYGFTSINNVYVDYEDWHYLYRALLECNKNNTISCKTLAIFEKQKSWWIVIQWKDTQKDNSITYEWAKDYNWER